MEYNVIYNKYKNFKITQNVFFKIYKNFQNTQYVFFKNREKKLKHIVCVFQKQIKIFKTHSMCFQK